jgi:ComF family protein
VLPQLSSLKRVALDLLFPPYCIGCGREGNYLCGSCRNDLPYIHPPVCPICGRPLSADNQCPGCIGKQSELDGIRAPFVFNGLLRRAIHELKYNNLRAAAPVLARFFFDYLLSNPLPGDVLVPVPVHAKRLRERGYNQSSLLAHELAKISDLPIDTDCLTRQTYIKPQARAATAVERLANTTGAFTCAGKHLKGKHVILIDDVSTSGATLNACAKALRAGGAVAVWGLVLALEL